MSNIDISNVINVTLTTTPQGLSNPNFNTIAIFTTEQPIWSGTDDYKIYLNAFDVEQDYGSTSEAAQQVKAIFSQLPNPKSTSGYIVTVPLQGTPQPAQPAQIVGTTADDVSTFGTGIYKIKVNSLTYTFSLSSTPTTAQDIITAVNSATNSGTQLDTIAILSADNPGNATATFTLSSLNTGSSAQITITKANGTDIAPLLSLPKETEYGRDEEITGEKIGDAITRIQSKVYFTGVLITEDLTDVDTISLSDTLQAMDKILFIGKSDPACITGVFTNIQAKTNTHTRCLSYIGSGNNTDTDKLNARLFVSAYASRAMSVDFTGVNTTNSMQLKSLSTIQPDSGMTQTLLQDCDKAGIDVYVGFGGAVGILSHGANSYFDEVYNELWFKASLQVAGFNYLKQTTGKAPQTSIGINGLKNAYGNTCIQAVQNQYLNPGTWDAPDTFGDPEMFHKNMEQFGYYIWAKPLSQQSSADRKHRKAPLIQIAVKTAGALHTSNVLVNINL